ncbi:MAG: DUF937 domain-containing protein [Actinomycetota bacterium]|nr:DUF937 domain-containing protein [Actinomycetota bacterium]
MASLMESLMGMLSGDTLDKISQQVGAPKEKTQQALPDILAVLTGGLAKNSSRQEGAQELSQALARDHDGSVLNNLGDYINHYKEADGNKILKHVLGSKQPEVEKNLSQKDGLDIGTIGNLLAMAAPIVMGVLGKTQRQSNLDAGSLSSLLGQEQNRAKNISPGAMDILNQVLGRKEESVQSQQSGASTAKKRSPLVTIIIIVAVVVVGFLLLRACGIF